MSFSMSDLAKVLKRRYFKGQVPDATLKKFPLFTLLSKDNDFVGEYLVVPIKYAKQQGRSRTFASAQTNTGNPKWDRWLIDVTADYVDAQVPREAVLRTKDPGAFVSMFADQIDDAIAVLDENTAGNLFRAQYGVRGQLSATTSVTTWAVTLADPTQECMFEPGMVLRAGPNADGTSLCSGSVTLGAVDRENGILYTTVSTSHWDDLMNSGGGALAVNYFLFQDGDATKGITGLPSWLLDSSPVAGAKFYDVDRYVDTRLYGTYYDGSTSVIEEAIKRGLAKCARRGGSPDKVFLSPDDYQDLEISLLNSNLLKRTVAKTEDGKYGFDGIEIGYGTGTATALADPKCPPNTAWGLEMDTWSLTYMGPKVGSTIIDEDGQLIRVYNADSYDIRCGNWTQLYCEKPGNNVRIKLR